jgi:hypothetical protein
MKITNSQNQIFERVFRDKSGKLIRATFAVYENGGRIKARLLHFVYIETLALAGKVLALAGKIKNAISNFEKKVKFLINPPKFSLEKIEVLGSKPRAPTF